MTVDENIIKARIVNRDVCVVAATINGQTIYGMLNPRINAVFRVSEQDVPRELVASSQPQQPADTPCPRCGKSGDQKPCTGCSKDKTEEGDVDTDMVEVTEPMAGVGFLGAITGAAKLAQAHLGLNAATDAMVAERTSICLSCPMNDLGRCKACGCYLWAKVRTNTEKCPSGKW